MKSIQIFCHPQLGGLVGCLLLVSIEAFQPRVGSAQTTLLLEASDVTPTLSTFQETGGGNRFVDEAAFMALHVQREAQHLQGRYDLIANANALTLATGFTPNPTVLRGTGGGNRQAEEVVNTRHTSTGPCLGFISSNPHEEITLEDRFSNLELVVESEADTTLIIAGPGGVWCNDDSQGRNPAITGEWLPGSYRVWIGAYTASEAPAYELSISDRSR